MPPSNFSSIPTGARQGLLRDTQPLKCLPGIGVPSYLDSGYAIDTTAREPEAAVRFVRHETHDTASRRDEPGLHCLGDQAPEPIQGTVVEAKAWAEPIQSP